MIFVYTGTGKGKTSACLGQMVRALGRGLRVTFAQFMKEDGKAGEQIFLHRCLGQNFRAGGAGFFLHEADWPEHRQAALVTLAWVRERIATSDVLIMDEILYALGHNLVSREELLDIFRTARVQGCHLVLSGRGFPDDLLEQVDLVTELQEKKHPWQAGLSAQEGLDF